MEEGVRGLWLCITELLFCVSYATQGDQIYRLFCDHDRYKRGATTALPGGVLEWIGKRWVALRGDESERAEQRYTQPAKQCLTSLLHGMPRMIHIKQRLSITSPTHTFPPPY